MSKSYWHEISQSAVIVQGMIEEKEMKRKEDRDKEPRVNLLDGLFQRGLGEREEPTQMGERIERGEKRRREGGEDECLICYLTIAREDWYSSKEHSDKKLKEIEGERRRGAGGTFQYKYMKKMEPGI
ncbi:hypothetical protein ElyMa_005651300 [Elysia marginata]|uniref:Uncharacterized protein n=1 Tax=Elysia marginata TaxID=1093978 RepID=A0AAV4FBR4_9GAST|nr:hypothetical protein ElyMa_005651300 [Elysia marginata]